MKLEELIMELRRIIDEAGVASDDANKSATNQAYSMADGGATKEVDYNKNEARERLRAAKELLDDEFLAE